MLRFSRVLPAACVLLFVATPRAQAQTTWDLTHVAGAGGRLSSNAIFTLSPGYGTIRVFTDPGPRSCGGRGMPTTCVDEVYANGYDNPLPNASKGIGVANCGYLMGVSFLSCAGGQIGSPTTLSALWLDLSGLAAGVTPSFLTLAALDGGDFWRVESSKSTSCTTTTVMNAGAVNGTGPSYGGSFADLAFGGSTCLLLLSGGGTYVLQSITTTGAPAGAGAVTATVPEPATLLLLAPGLVALGRWGRRRKR